MPDEIDLAEAALPVGTRFEYLGRACVVTHYVCWAAYVHASFIAGLYFDYADDRGRLRSRVVGPRELASFLKTIQHIRVSS